MRRLSTYQPPTSHYMNGEIKSSIERNIFPSSSPLSPLYPEENNDTICALAQLESVDYYYSCWNHLTRFITIVSVWCRKGECAVIISFLRLNSSHSLPISRAIESSSLSNQTIINRSVSTASYIRVLFVMFPQVNTRTYGRNSDRLDGVRSIVLLLRRTLQPARTLYGHPWYVLVYAHLTFNYSICNYAVDNRGIPIEEIEE